MHQILTIDIGNSNIVSVLYDDQGNILSHHRTETIKSPDRKAYESFFQQIHQSLGIDKPDAIIISCVVPPVRDTVLSIADEKYPMSHNLSVDPGKIPGFKVDLPDPRELGADIAATAVGAYYQEDQVTIIADLGSATKLSVVNRNFEIIGVIILPGLQFQAKSLHEMIPHLPEIDMRKPARLLGRDTIGAIASGIIYGGLAAVKGLADEIEKELGQPCKKLITGGLAKLYSQDDLGDFEYDEFLLSDGLFHIARTTLGQ